MIIMGGWVGGWTRLEFGYFTFLNMNHLSLCSRSSVVDGCIQAHASMQIIYLKVAHQTRNYSQEPESFHRWYSHNVHYV